MKKNGNNNESNGASVIAFCLLTERKTKPSKTYASYRLVGLVTNKIITSLNSLITSKVKLSNILLKSIVTICQWKDFITFRQSVRKIWHG